MDALDNDRRRPIKVWRDPDTGRWSYACHLHSILGYSEIPHRRGAGWLNEATAGDKARDHLFLVHGMRDTHRGQIIDPRPFRRLSQLRWPA